MSKSNDMSNVLNAEERRSLKSLEKVIESGVESFVATGSALKQIRDERLYRESYKTFESYVKDKWDFERRHAYRLIDASDIKADLCPIGHKIEKANEIKTESQLRELVSVPRESLEEVIEKAAEIAGDAPMTAKVIKEAREQVLETEEDNEEHEEDEEDPFGDPEPEVPAPLQCVPWFKEQLRMVNELKRNLDRVQKAPGIELFMSRQRTILREVEHVKGGLMAAMPHSMCPRCNGKTCTQCGNMGWVNKQRFDELGGA